MKPILHSAFIGCAAWIVCFDSAFAAAQSDVDLPPNPRLQAIVDQAVSRTLDEFAEKKLQTNQLALTLVDFTEPDRPAQASYRGEAKIYPASVVKLFYLAAAHRWMEDGKLEDTAELRRALRDMIVDSCNEATHYVLDLLTDTTSGPELPASAMAEWAHKRNAVNRYFASLGYTNINVNQKPWNEGPYGREREFVGQNYENRNLLTTEATARLLADIVQHRCVTAARSKAMLELLARDLADKRSSQGTNFTGRALPPEAKLWSKAGWTSTTRHDAACVELPDGRRFVLVTFTTQHAYEREIIPRITTLVMDGLSRLHRPSQ